MGLFTGWKFGVPVKVHAQNRPDQSKLPEDSRLIDENDHTFTIVGDGSYTQAARRIFICSKDNFHYEPIPHSVGGAGCRTRYPVCQSNKQAAYCNSGNVLDHLQGCNSNIHPLPVATLTIDGKTIELSLETVDRLKGILRR